MVIVSGANVAVIADVHVGPQLLKDSYDLVHIRLGGHAFLGGLLLNFQTVLVRTGEKEHIIPLHAPKAGDGVAGHGGVAMPDVGIAGGVINGRGDIKLFLIHRSLLIQIH